MNEIHKLVSQLEEALINEDIKRASKLALKLKWKADILAMKLFDRSQ